MGFHKGWRDQRDRNAKRSDLLTQRLRESLQGKLTGGVHPCIGGSDLTERRADIENAPVALLAHRGQYCLDHTDGSKQVGIELGLDFSDTTLLYGANLRVTSVVDQDIN